MTQSTHQPTNPPTHQPTKGDMPVTELKPCPCCTSTNLVPPPKHWSDGVVYCRACGLRANSPEAWNTRPTPPTVPAGDVEKVARAMRLSLSGQNRLGWAIPTVQQSEHMARAAIAAMQPRSGEAEGDDEGPCTDCWDSGISQNEVPCSCDAGRIEALSRAELASADNPQIAIEKGNPGTVAIETAEPASGAGEPVAWMYTGRGYRPYASAQRLKPHPHLSETPLFPGVDNAERLREMLIELCQSAECAAGADEGVSPDEAYSEILSSMGSAMAVSYSRARQALAASTGGEA